MRASIAAAALSVVFAAQAFDRPPSRPAPTLTLAANPSTVVAGQSSTISWSSTNASLCQATFGSQTGAVPLSGSRAYVFPATSTLSMTCSGTGGTVTRSVTVMVTNVPPPPPPAPDAVLSWSHPTTATTDGVQRALSLSEIRETIIEWSSGAMFSSVDGSQIVPAPAMTASAPGPVSGSTRCYRARTVMHPIAGTTTNPSEPSNVACKSP